MFYGKYCFWYENLSPTCPFCVIHICVVARGGQYATVFVQVAIGSYFYVFLASGRRNFVAKGEAQGMVRKYIGRILGIA